MPKSKSAPHGAKSAKSAETVLTKVLSKNIFGLDPPSLKLRHGRKLWKDAEKCEGPTEAAYEGNEKKVLNSYQVQGRNI